MRLRHVAVIALGSVGRRHLRILRRLKYDLKITVVRSGRGGDIEEESLADRIVYSLSDAISSGIQAAIIASPAPMHVSQALELISAGVHLLIEKPLATSISEVSCLMDADRNSKTVTLMGFVMRHHPAAEMFKKQLDDGRLGRRLHTQIESRSYLPDWRTNKQYKDSVSASRELGGGVLFELSHEFDYSRWFLGDVRNVIGRLQNSGLLHLDVEESADIIMEHVSGQVTNMHLSFNEKSPSRFRLITGENGQLFWDSLNQVIEWRPNNGSIDRFQYGYEYDHVYELQILHFIDCIENKSSPKVGLSDGLASLKIIEAIRISDRTGSRVAVG